MRTCNYDFIEIGFRGNKWISGCKKEILYIVPMGVGEATPPLPTNNGAKFCTFCGKKIKLTTRTPKQQPKIPVTPPPELPPRAMERPPKPHPLPRPPKLLVIDREHNTYDGWRAKGYQVQKGEKSIGRNAEGLALFHKKQTKMIPDQLDDGFPDIDDIFLDRDW